MPIKFLSGLDIPVTSSLLKTDANGNIVAAVLDTDYLGPDIPNGYAWIGNASGVATATDLTNYHDSRYVNVSGDTMTGNLRVNPGTGQYADYKNSQIWTNSAYSIQVGTNNPLTFYTNAAERMRITSAGNVGIGTTAPNATLEANGAVTFANVDTFGQFVIKAASGTTGDLLNFGVDTANSLAFIQAVERGVNTIPLSLQRYGGNVGIGTTSPSQKLHLSGGHFLIDNNQEIRQKDSAGTQRTIIELDSSNQLNLGGSYSGATRFIGGGSYTERMRIHTNGDVGIGTTAPQSRLDVEGTITVRNSTLLQRYVSSWANAPTHSVIYNGWTATMGDYVYLKAQGNSTGNHGMIIVGDNVTYIGRSNAETGAVTGLDATWATINATGLGIGTTSPDKKLTVSQSADGSGIRVYGYDDKSTSYADLYVDGSGNTKLTCSNPGTSAYLQINSPNYLSLDATSLIYTSSVFRVYDAGRLDFGSGGDFNIKYDSVNDILKLHHTASADGVTIDNSGKVGIGTTSPSERVEVSGGAAHTYVKIHNNGGYKSGLKFVGGSVDVWDVYLDDATNKFHIGEDGIDYVTVSSGGNVGIGTTSPSQKLHVDGNIRVGDSNDVIYSNRFTTLSNANLQITANTGYDTLFNNGGSERMRITSAGNVGIGTTSPQNKLDIVGTVNSDGFQNEEGSGVRVVAPGGGSADLGSSVTGAIKVTLPQSWTNTMMSFTVRVFDYSGNESFDVRVHGYNYSGGGGYWANTTAYIASSNEADRNFTVRFGHDGTKCCITIGEVTSTWSYLKVQVVDFQGSHGGFSSNEWDDGWAISSVTTLPTNIDQTRSNLQVNNWRRNGQDLYYSSGTGNVGIGTTSPGAALDVVGTIKTNAHGDSSQWSTAYGWGNHGTQGYATQTWTNTQIANLVDSAPATLDTLNELAAALGDDPNFATTVTNSIATKLPLAGGTMTGDINIQTNLIKGGSTSHDYLDFDDDSTSYSAGVNATVLSSVSDLVLRTNANDGGGGEFAIWTGSAASGSAIMNLSTSGVMSTGDGFTSTKGNTAYGWGDHSTAGYAASSHTHSYLPLSGGTLTGGLVASGGISGLTLSSGISGSNYNISGVNQITINDPGEGIVFSGTTNVTLYAIDDATDSIMNFSNATELRRNNNKVWDAGNDGSGSGLDADTVDGIQASSFLRSDANDTATGNINFTGAPTIGGNTIWNAGNDGSGSGLDADLLDGNHASAFALSSHTHSYLPLSGGTLTGTLTLNGLVQNTLGAKLEIQNGVDGGNSRGIFLWQSTDSAWGIYMSTSGAGKSLSGGTAPTALDGTTQHHVRFRSGQGTTNGFIWENSGNVALMSLNGNTGKFYTKHAIYPSNQTTNYVDSTRIANWQTAYSDRLKWDGGSSGLNAATGRTSLGLGSAAVEDSSAFAAASHTHSYDNYQSWNLKTNGTQRTTINSGGNLDIVGGTNVSVSYSAGGVVTLSSTDTNTWRGIDDVPVNGQTAESISSNWAYDHANASNPHSITPALIGAATSSHTHAISTGYSGSITAGGSNGTMFSLDSRDTRTVNQDPDDFNHGVLFEFKTNSTTGLSDGGSYHGLMHWRSYGNGTDLSGGYPAQIAYTASANLWMRLGTSGTTWGSWRRFLHTGDLDNTPLTGVPTAPTAAAGTNTTQIATTAFVGTAVSNLVDSAPGTLDTLNELAAALGDDPNFATTVTNSIATKLPLAGGTLTGNLTLAASNKLIINKTSGSMIDTGAQLDAFGYNANYGHYIRGNTGYLYGNATYHDGTANRALWHEGNDGSGSGLDADLLDGIQAASFLRSDANDTATGNINFTGTPTISGNTIWNAGNDGAGSGLDADLLDGNHASAFSLSGHNHTDLNLTGRIYNGGDTYSFDLRDHGDHAWFRNQHGAWTFQTGTSGDDWTQTFSLTLPAAGSTVNAVWAELGQTDSNDVNGGRYRGLRIVKDTGGVVDGDVRAGSYQIGERATASGLGRTVLIEGVANATNGEGSGRIFFSEHNSTSVSADKYGLSLYYEGDPNAAMPSGFQPNTGNATWSLRRHNNSINGVAIMSGSRSNNHVTFSGSLYASSGSTSNNAYAFSGDTNTGIYRPAADQMGLVAGGSRKVLVTTSGTTVQNGNLTVSSGNKLSVGTTSSAGILDIGTTSGYEIYFSGTSPANIWGASGHMYIATSSGNDLRLGANGTNSIMNIVGDRVGINTTTPNTDSALTVNAKVGGTYTLRVSGDTLFSAGHVYTSGSAAYDIGTDANRWAVVYCETLDTAGIHEANLANKKVGELPTGTPLVWKDGEAVASTQLADYMKIGIAVEGSDSPLVHGAEPVLCVGEVNEGDYLITSEKAGHAEAITREDAKEQDLMDCVIGKALENGNGESHLIKTWLTI